MTEVPVIYLPQAETQIRGLYRTIAADRSPDIAARYTARIVAHCDELALFPKRGTLREDIRPGLRMTSFQKRILIAFAVETTRVVILGIFYGGRDYEAALNDDDAGA